VFENVQLGTGTQRKHLGTRGFMIAASAWMGRRLMAFPFCKSQMTTDCCQFVVSHTMMNLSDSMEVLPNLMKSCEIPKAGRFTNLPEIDGQDLRHFQQGWTN
jgi:hypothetical protein